MSVYLKAIVAAVIGGLMNVAVVWQAAVTDNKITNDEKQLIWTTVIGAVVAVVGVFFARNKVPEV